jgi:CheY-like chemotaxis protein
MNQRGAKDIVLVDDSVDDIDILERCFRRSSLADTYQFRAFQSGPDFLAHMEEVSSGQADMPAVVLLDINMPELDGFETLRRLRAEPKFESVPVVVFVTNSDRVSDLERAQRLGARFTEKFDGVQSGVDFFNQLFHAT